MMPYVRRVPTADNVADLPTREQYMENFMQNFPGVKTEIGSDDSTCQYVRLLAGGGLRSNMDDTHGPDVLW